jgi:hypothetical protein
MPHSEAPEQFGWDDQEHCYVSKQRSTSDELRQMLSAIARADLGCIRYRGQDPRVVAALAEIHELDKCDQPSPRERGASAIHIRGAYAQRRRRYRADRGSLLPLLLSGGT